MIDMYIKLIQAGKWEVVDVPIQYRSKVEARMKENEGVEQNA